MVSKAEKLIVVPVDGSENALKSLDYISRIFGSRHHLRVSLVYLLPQLPAVFFEDSAQSRQRADELQQMEQRSSQMGERILADAKQRLLGIGFTKRAVEAVFRKIEVGVARDICFPARM